MAIYSLTHKAVHPKQDAPMDTLEHGVTIELGGGLLCMEVEDEDYKN
jgi:hypothetical protein